DGDDGPAGYLVPQDAQINVRDSFLPMQIVHDALTALACRHCLVILDCCFSGAFRWAAMRSATELPKTLYRERYERFLRSPAWQVLTSAAYDQEALDVIVGGGFGTRSAQVAQSVARDHSPFALALFDALTGSGPTSSDANGDGVVAATELYLHLRDVVETRAKAEARHWQTPGLWPLQKHDKGEYIFLLGEPDLPPAPALTAENNPYRGLKSYNADDAELFFGRTALVKELAALVEANPLTVVLGASGTGKSSVVKAGVAPYLTGSADREGEQQDVAANGAGHTDEPIVWRALEPLRPTETPLLALAELVAEHVPGASEAPGTLPPEVYIETALTNWLSAHTKQNLLLIVDQFEELVTLCRDEQEREAFQRLLQRLLDQHPDQLHIVLTLRTDFEPQFAESPLAVRWQQGRFVVPPMT
ncbi:MAG: ATP-binding protein, partial [Caldilineaceae bacterium]|nr:ATP-binding protein [Caldilineaceae bacterium]